MEFLGDSVDIDIDIDFVTPSVVDYDTSSAAVSVIREGDPPSSPSQTNNGKAARDESFESSTAVIDEARKTASRLVEATDEEKSITAEEAVAMFKTLGVDKEQFGDGDQCGGRTTPENAEENISAPGKGSHSCSSLERGHSLVDALEALAEANTIGGEPQEPPRQQEGTEPLASGNRNESGDLGHAVSVKISVQHTGDMAAEDGVVEERASTVPTATLRETCDPSSSTSTNKKEDLSSWKAKRDRFLGTPRPKLKSLPKSNLTPGVTANDVGSDSIAVSVDAFGEQSPDTVPVPLLQAKNPDQEPKDFFEAALDTIGMDTICGVDEDSLRHQLESLEIVTSGVPFLPQDLFANNPVLVLLPLEVDEESLRQEPIFPQDPFANNPVLVPLPLEVDEESLRQEPILPQDPFANNPILVPLPLEDDEESLRQEPILPQDPFANNPILVPLPLEDDEQSLRQQIGDSKKITTSVLPILPQDPVVNNPILVPLPPEECSAFFPSQQ